VVLVIVVAGAVAGYAAWRRQVLVRRAQDEFMANLQPDTRASIERFLSAYYRRNEGRER
jgi:hypothetical protein